MPALVRVQVLLCNLDLNMTWTGLSCQRACRNWHSAESGQQESSLSSSLLPGQRETALLLCLMLYCIRSVWTQAVVSYHWNMLNFPFNDYVRKMGAAYPSLLSVYRTGLSSACQMTNGKTAGIFWTVTTISGSTAKHIWSITFCVVNQSYLPHLFEGDIKKVFNGAFL